MTRETHISGELERHFRERSVLAASIGALIFLLIAPLDFISAPGLAVRFLIFRIAAAAGLLLVGRMAARAAHPRALRAWLLAGVAIGAVAIELMILAHGGYRSAYIDGMLLLAVTVLGFIPGSARFNLLLAGTIYTIFLAPLLLWGEPMPGRVFFTQNYLFIAILAVMILVQHLHRSSVKSRISLAFDLAANERRLEEQVAERTAELINASRQWKAAFDSQNDLILMVDSDGLVVKVNIATALFSGKAPGNIIGTPVAALLQHAGLGRTREALEAVGRIGKRVAVELRHDPSGRWFVATAEPIPQGRAQAGGAVLTLRDITDMKRLERAVTEARDDWEETFNSIQEGITIHDANFVVLRANAAARRMLGCGDAALEGNKCFEMFHDLEGPVGGCPGCETLRTGRPTTIDLHEPLLGRHLEIATLPRADGGITHVVHDISERKQAMDELSRAAERLQGILGCAPFGVFIVNEQLRVEFANAAMAAITGYQREHFAGAFLGDFPGCRELGMLPNVKGALEGVPFHFGPTGYHCHGGKRIVGQFTGIPIEEDGRRKAVVFVEDVTTLAVAEEERRRLNALLLQAQKMESIGTLASGIAHDFNNILLAVIGLTDAAIEKLPADDMARPELEEVIGAAERGAELVQQLLAFSRRQELQMRPVDLRLLVEETRSMLSHVIPKKIAVSARDTGEVPLVVADPVQIGQVLMNLAVNARDAMPEGGTLAIETGAVEVAAEDAAHPGLAPGSYALLTVSDTGTGMSPEIQAKIFDPFFSTKEPGQGTGLGLATVYGIVSQHGGAVRVESAPGAGATFFIYLPAVPGAKAVGFRPVPRGSETVLVVEDDALARHVLGRKLGDLGYRVLAAADGEEALRLLESEGARPDLLMCDIVLPGIGARQVIAVARARVAGVRVVFLSGHPESQLAQRGLLEPGDVLLSKGLGPEEICRRLRQVIDDTVLE